MNHQSASYSYQKLQKDYESLKGEIIDQKILKIYSEFEFKYFNFAEMSIEGIESNKDEIKEKLFHFLNINRFITFQLYNNKEYSEIWPNKKIRNLSSSQLNAIFCVEKNCFIFESINNDLLRFLLHEVHSTLISTSSRKITKELQIGIFDQTVNQEIELFCQYFIKDIQKNEFVNYTIKPIASFLIRRFYQPSDYFKDPSFFIFDQQIDQKEQEIKTNLLNLIRSTDSNDINNNYQLLRKEIKEEREEEEEGNENKNICFKDDDFIKLRLIYSNYETFSSIYLVFHLPSLYVFALKTTNEPTNHEVDFCLKYFHRCFTRFYGFCVKDGKEIGFVYEFMSNSSLSNFYSNRKEKVDLIFSVTAMLRILQGIHYLQSNSLIHRDLKPGNVLVDHDFNCFISDFETIRKINENGFIEQEMTGNIGSFVYASPEQHEENRASFPTDIFSFGQIVYFLFANNAPIYQPYLNESSLNIANFSDLFHGCVKYDPEERWTLSDIESHLEDELLLKPFFESLFIENKSLKINDIIHYFIECIYFSLQIEKGTNVFIAKIFYFHSTNMNYIKNQHSVNDEYKILDKDKIGNFFYYLGCHCEKEEDEDILSILCFHYYELAAKLKNVDAIYTLGSIYENGRFGFQDYKKAVEYYELAGNDTRALYRLGNIDENGPLEKKDYTRFVGYYESLAKQNDVKALYQLGQFYENDSIVRRDYGKAIYYFELAAKQKHISSIHRLATIYEEGIYVKKDIPRSIYYSEILVKENDLDSIFRLATFYESGEGVKQDYLKAIEYYELLVRHFDGDAAYKLGLFYENGKGVERNLDKAIEYYEIAAQYMNSDAFLKLGSFHEEGKKYPQNYIKAIECYESSAELDNSLAYLRLANIFYYGKGVDADIDKAKYNYNKIIEMNKPELYSFKVCHNGSYYIACNDLGLIHLIDNKTEDKEIGINFIKEAAFAEYSYAQNNLGLIYQLFQKEIENAEYLFGRSSKQNFALADFNLAHLYEIKKDEEKAIEYYIKASQDEDQPLLFRSNEIKDDGIELSKTFVCCLTNLILTDFYLSTEQTAINLESAKQYFISSLSKLIKQTNDSHYSFQFDYIEVKDEEEKKFSYIRKFILYFSDFHLSDFVNVEELINSYEKINEIEFQQENNDEEFVCINKMKNKENIADFYDKNESPSQLVDENIEFDKITEPSILFDLAVQNKKSKHLFIHEIKQIIKIMKTILNTPPYYILFGRMFHPIEKSTHSNTNQTDMN